VDLLNKYEIISELGRGAMGAVYKARDPLINRLVALKTIPPGPGRKPISSSVFTRKRVPQALSSIPTSSPL
jgi:serine/threonine protein kinase